MIEITAFISGAVVMILEIVGSRVIAPYLGTSTLVWTSLIGVILASLSAGYALGGKIADKRTDIKTLALIIFVAGILTGSIAYFRYILVFFGRFETNIGITAIFSTLILFGPTTIALGMVSPYLVRLKIKNVETSGRTVGRLYALGTVGSILGTFLGGFILISTLGTGKIILLLSAILLALSAFILLSKKFLPRVLLLTCAFIAGSVIAFSDENFFKEKKNLIADIDTEYQRLWIYDDTDQQSGKNIRFLNNTVFVSQSAFDIANPENLVFEYTKMFDLAMHFNPEEHHALLIGGGVFTYPRHFISLSPKNTIDVVEIDTELTNVAKKYFSFNDDPRIHVINQDGRTFLNNIKEKYDTVILDAYSSYASIPFQLTTTQSFKLISDALTNNGVVIANVLAPIEGKGGELFRAFYTTLKSVFPQVLVFQANPGLDTKQPQNIIVIGLKDKTLPELSSKDKTIQNMLSRIWKEKIDENIPVLTDELAPIEKYMAKMIFGLPFGSQAPK